MNAKRDVVEARPTTGLSATPMILSSSWQANARHAEALIAETEQVIAPLGLALSREKTSIAHIDEGIEFLGWRIQRQTGRKGRPQIYTYPSKPSLQAVMGKVKQITRTGQNQTLDQLLNRLNPVLRGW